MNKEEDYNIAERYRVVRKHLDGLGYRQALSLDALPLIERLLADLVQTTESLKHFKTVAQENIEVCSQLQLAAEPYKCDNARLVQECNQLHLNLLETKEAQQKQIRDLRKQVRKLESECSDLQLASSRNLKKIKDLEVESAGKSGKILELLGKCCKPVISNTSLAVKKRACYPLRRPTLECDPLPRTGSSSATLPSSSNVDPHVVDLLGMADHRMNCLNREVTKLKGDLTQQTDNVYILKTQLATKEKEIHRLKKMLEGGRPLTAVTKDCHCNCNKRADKAFKKPDKSSKIVESGVDSNEIKILQQAKQELEQQLKDSTSKQHEAMSRAMELAERNEELEKELKDIDHIALAVEADCNSAAQENNRRVCRLQAKLDDVMTQVHVLESELTVERRESQELRADLEACKLENRNIQRVLESTLDEKKQMTDRINELTIIEKRLNDEIEKLTKNCAFQSQEICQLESSFNTLKDKVPTIGGGGDDKPEEKPGKGKGEKNDKNKGKKVLKKKLASKGLPRSSSPERKKNPQIPKEDEVTKDVYYTENQKTENEKDTTIVALKHTIERLETERDFFRNEYNKFREQFNMGSDRDKADLWTQACELRRQLNEKEQAMAELQREKKELCREKFNLEARLQTSKSQQRRPCIPCSPCSSCRPVGPCTCPPPSPPPGGDATPSKIMMERLERERDTARADVDRLIEERDALRERLKMAAEAHTCEQRRLRESLNEAELRLKQLERERQDFLVNQGTRRATINGLEDQLEDMRQELRKTKEELTTQRTQYFQLRALQEQTDQALGDVQGQLGQSETELTKALDRNRSIEQQQLQLDNQAKELKSEVNILRCNLAQLDQEKDQLLMTLDEKTERIAALEREVRFKEQQTTGMEQQIQDLQHKQQICVDQSAEQERQLRTMEVEIDSLQRQLASASIDKENAIRENGRIQDDMAAVTCECRNLQRELEVSRAESYDLKRQLQTYVTEVRRAEDLLNRKENERSEMLNHFRSLSMEATVLENNNQSLESEAAEARGALQTARDRLLDLERQLADRDCLIRGYETQIAELTQSVASMETQLRQQGEQRKRAEADLNAVRDLCVKLDQQKETLMQQLGDKDSMKVQCEAQLARLKTEQTMVQDQMNRDHVAVDRLEALLAQARQEAMSNQATNQELQTEMCRLKQKICEVQNKLSMETAELRRYQNQAAEYSKQISELRRQMTNERFDRARKEEEGRRASQAPSPRPSFQHQTCPPCNPLYGPTPAPRPDPKTVNDWNSPRKPDSAQGDMKTEAQRTNRFNTTHSHESTCSSSTNCQSSSNRISNESNVQGNEDDVACINIILNSGMGAEAGQIAKISENKSQTIATGSGVNATSVHMPNQSNKAKSVFSQTECNVKSTRSQTDNNVNNYSKTTKSENNINTENLAKPAGKKTLTISSKPTVWPQSAEGVGMPDEKPSNFKRGKEHGSETLSKSHVVLEDTNSSVDNLRRSSPVEKEREYGRLSERINRTLNDLQIKDSSDKNISNTQIGKRNRGTQHKMTNESNKSSVTCGTQPCQVAGCQTDESKTYPYPEDPTVENEPPEAKRTIPSVFSNNPTVPIVSINTNTTGTQKTPRTNQWSSACANATRSQLCFCTGPNISPCGVKKPFTEEEMNRIPVNTRLNNNCCCSDSDMQSRRSGDIKDTIKAESKSTEIKTKVSDKYVSHGSPSLDIERSRVNFTQTGNFRLVDSSTNTDEEKLVTSGYNTSESKNYFETDETNVTGTKPALNSNEMRTVETKNTCCGENLVGTESYPHSSKANENDGTLHRLRRELDYTSQSRIPFTEASIDAGVGSSFQNSDVQNACCMAESLMDSMANTVRSSRGTSSGMTASDLTRPEFVRMLTEIKEHTCSLEVQLAAMNDTMKSKRGLMGDVVGASLEQHRVGLQNERSCGSLDAHEYSQFKKFEIPNVPSSSRYTPTLSTYPGISRESDPTKHLSLPCCLQLDGATSPLVAYKHPTVEPYCQRMDTSVDDRRHIATSTPIRKQIKSTISQTDTTCCTQTVHKDEPRVLNLATVPKKKKVATQTSRSTIPAKIIKINDTTPIPPKRKPRRPVFRTTKYKGYILPSPRTSMHKISRHKIDKSSSPLTVIITPPQSPNSSVYMVPSKRSVRKSSRTISTRINKLPTTLYKRPSSSSRLKSRSQSPRYRLLPPKTIKGGSKDLSTACADCQSSDDHITTATEVNSRELIRTPPKPHSSLYTLRGTKASKVHDSRTNVTDLRTRPFTIKSVRPVKSTIPLEYQGPGGADGKLSRTGSPHTSARPALLGTDSTRRPHPFSLKKMIFAPHLKSNTVSYESVDPCCDPMDRIDAYTQSQTTPRVQETQQDRVHSSRPSPDRGGSIRVVRKNKVNQPRSRPSDDVLSRLLRDRSRQHIAYTANIGQQNTPFTVNSPTNKFESEEELHLTDYGIGSKNRSPSKEMKSNIRSKIRENNSSVNLEKLKLAETETTPLSVLPLVSSDRRKSKSTPKELPALSRYPTRQESLNMKSNSKQRVIESKSIVDKNLDNLTEKCSKTGSQQDPKCTIRVTLNLDDTPSSDNISDS